MMMKYGPGVPYYQDTTGDIRILSAMCASKRLPCVDYNGHCPHYHSGIAHCVNVAACDLAKDWIAVLDNNYPDDRNIVWMSVSEFRKRWHGWSYGILKETPGLYDRGTGGGGYEGEVDKSGQLTFGLVRATAAQMAPVTLDGQPSNVDKVLAIIGPEMVPAKPDKPAGPAMPKLDPAILTHPAVVIGAAALGVYLLRRKK